MLYEVITSKAKWLERFKTEDAKNKAEEALKLHKASMEMLDRIETEKMLQANAVFGIFPANTVNDDDIEVYADESRSEVLTTFHCLREQQDSYNFV